MNKGCLIVTILAFILLAVAGIGTFIIGGSYNSMVKLEENVNSAWSQVENVYQRRMDLIPNLVQTVKGYAAHEKSVFTEVTEARSKVGSMQISKDMLSDPHKFESFQKTQGDLGGALSRLMVVMENYPQLKADQNFMALQSQLEGTENRITVERMNFNTAAQAYNTAIRQFPKAMIAGMFGFKAKAYFKMKEGAENAPKVDFGA